MSERNLAHTKNECVVIQQWTNPQHDQCAALAITRFGEGAGEADLEACSAGLLQTWCLGSAHWLLCPDSGTMTYETSELSATC